MGKFLIIALASLFCCGMLAHYVPAVQGHAFFVSGNSITWTMLGFVGFIIGGYKLSGK